MAGNTPAGSRPSGAGTRAGTTAQTQVQSPGPSSTSASTSDTAQMPGTGTEPGPVLRLRGATRKEEGSLGGGARARRPRIQWAEDVVDNEGLGRKKSKVCCIYHAPKAVDESSDESSSDSSSDDSDSDDGGARPSGRGKKDCGHEGHDHGKDKGKGRARSPNAYEKVPKVKGKGKE
ncbi:Type 1 phosphatases regulator YPI1 [Lachnellula arida]|uniref:Type 1 phosphatases regulator n=1 Tax=Lachnellula arida TaxID=1316785 RepID=A0A8T9BM52_9HELO|nr:Type 1 phosphatases regulator YPI1 [Lachnellula arida]